MCWLARIRRPIVKENALSAWTPTPARRCGRTVSTCGCPMCRTHAWPGPRWWVIRETGNVYALGVCGYFQCIDGDTGKTIWSIPMHEYFGMLTTYGGRTNFPVIADDLVIVGGVMTNWAELAKPAHRLVAFDKRTGDIVWFNGTRIGPYDTNYSAPTVTLIDGQNSLVFGSGDGQPVGISTAHGPADLAL